MRPWATFSQPQSERQCVTAKHCDPCPEPNPCLVALVKEIVAETGGSAAPDYIDYAGPPTDVPPSLQNIVVDVNGRQWQYFQNTWN
jgi:hypothetical protein